MPLPEAKKGGSSAHPCFPIPEKQSAHQARPSPGLAEPDALIVFQEWESMDALMTHLSSPQVEAFLRQLPEISDSGITTRRYLVQEVEDSEAVVVVNQAPIIH